MFVPIAINYEIHGNYAVLFPTLPGCTSMGENLDDAIENATVAAESHISILIEYDEFVPMPIYNVHDLMLQKSYENCVWKMIEIHT